MDVTSLILGFILGVIVVFLILSLTIFIANKRFMKQSIDSLKITNTNVKEIITSKQNKIIKSKKLGISNNYNLIKDLTKDSIMEIAEYYYPESKHPHFEITLIEALDMSERVTERLKAMLDIKTVGFIKNIRISQIIQILEFKKNIENNSIYRFSQKYKLDKVVSYGYAALNIANPGYWVRRFITTSTLETTLRGIGVMTLNIVGEEAITLYSKKIIDNRDKILDKELERYIREIEMTGS